LESISRIINDSNFVRVRGMGPRNLFLKLEAFNAAGSIKIKTALGMVDAVEASGRLTPDSVLIESSSGSLGVALSIISAERGYRFTCVVDANTAPTNIKQMKLLGANVVMITERDQNGGYLGNRIAYIQKQVASDARHLWLNQYANPENPRAHARGTARAIVNAFEQVDYLVVGAGTTGTLMGCQQYFSQHSPATRIVAVDSVGSVTFGHPPGPRYVPGLGTSRKPEIFDPHGIHQLEMVPEIDTIAMCRYLARSNGILAGGSTGTVLAAVYRMRDAFPPGATVVAISPDFGERYLDTIYDDEWVIDRFGRIPPALVPQDDKASPVEAAAAK
jgi:2,3-diaminopropionate biosynthesis protein SbnA